MNYVFDSNSIITMGHYFPGVFRSFWERMASYIQAGRVMSVREVRKELIQGNARQHLADWVKANRQIFRTPTEDELDHVAGVFRVPHFQQAVRRKQLLRGSPVADPFLVAAAMEHGLCVVTEEAHKPNSAQLPNVCEHFRVHCMSLEGFLTAESWTF